MKIVVIGGTGLIGSKLVKGDRRAGAVQARLGTARFENWLSGPP